MYPEKRSTTSPASPAITGPRPGAGLVEQAARFDPDYLLGERGRAPDRRGRAPSARRRAARRHHRHGHADHRRRRGRHRRHRHLHAPPAAGRRGVPGPRARPTSVKELGRARRPGRRHRRRRRQRRRLGADARADWPPRSPWCTGARQFRAHAASVADMETGIDGRRHRRPGRLPWRASDRLHTVHVKGKDGVVTPYQAHSVDRRARVHRRPRAAARRGASTSCDRKIVVDTAMRTSVPGVYSAGDITDYAGQGAADLRRLRRGRHRGQQRRDVPRPRPATVPRAHQRRPAGIGAAGRALSPSTEEIRVPYVIASRVHRHDGHVLRRGVPRRLHLRGRPQALHQPQGVHRLRRLRAGLPGRGDHPGPPGGRRRRAARRGQPAVLHRACCPAGTRRWAARAAPRKVGEIGVDTELVESHD